MKKQTTKLRFSEADLESPDTRKAAEKAEKAVEKADEAKARLPSGTKLRTKKASAEALHAYMAEVLPTYDRDRVHTSDIKKLIQWYNILVSNGVTEFLPAEEETATEE